MVTTSQTQTGLIVSLNISAWNRHRLDKTATDAVEQRFENEHRTVKARKKLLAKSETFKRVEQEITQLRQWHKTNTLLWDDNGRRLLSSARYFDYTTNFNDFKSRIAAALDDCLQSYAADQQVDALTLAKLYDPDDYPSPAEIRTQYAIDLTFEPIPYSASSLDLEKLDPHLKAAIEQTTQRRIEASVKDALDRVREVAERFTKTLAAAQQEPDKAPRFHQTMVQNARELVGLLPALDITHNPDVAALVQQVEAGLCKFDTEQLKTSPSAQTSTLEAAKGILSRLDGLL